MTVDYVMTIEEVQEACACWIRDRYSLTVMPGDLQPVLDYERADERTTFGGMKASGPAKVVAAKGSKVAK